MQQSNKNILSLIALASLALMFCLPFMVSYHKWPELDYYANVVALIAGLVSLTALIQTSNKSIAIPHLTLLPITLMVILMIQWQAGVGFYWQKTAIAALYLFWGALLMVATATLKQIYSAKKIITCLSYALLIGSIFNVLVVFMQLMNWDQFFWTLEQSGTSYVGNLAQRNLLTDYLCLGLTSLLYLNASKHVSNQATVIFILLILTALSLAGSRMSWLFIILITALFYCYGKKNNHSQWQPSSKLILTVPIAFAVIQLIAPELLSIFNLNTMPSPVERVAKMAGQKSFRFEFIQQSIAVIRAHPFLGIGWGQYPWYDLLLADTFSEHRGFTTHTHNLYVQFLVECGLFAFAAVLIASLYWVINRLKNTATLEQWWLLLIAGIIFTHSMLEYPLWYAHFLGVFAVVLALGDRHISYSIKKPLVPSLAFIIILFTSLTLITITNVQYKQIEYWVSYYPKMSKQERYAMLKTMSGMQAKTLMAQPLHMVLTRAYSILPRKQAPLKFKIAKYEAMMHYVQDKQDIYRYVLLLAADGQTEKAVKFLTRAYSRQPGYADTFKKQIIKAAQKGNQDFIALQQALIKLQGSSLHE